MEEVHYCGRRRKRRRRPLLGVRRRAAEENFFSVSSAAYEEYRIENKNSSTKAFTIEIIRLE